MPFTSTDELLEHYRKRAHLTDPIKTRYPAGVGSHAALTRRYTTAIAAAQRRPQAVFKVVSKLSGGVSIQKALDYISREAELDLEMANADYLRDNTDIAGLVEQWRNTFSTRKNGVDAVHLMMSAPPGADPDAALEAARAFCADQFPTHEYAFVSHDDTANPHVHVIVKHRNIENEPLPWRKADLTHYREAWAHHCFERGIEASASYRSERGVYEKGVSMARRRSKDREEEQNDREKERKRDKPITNPSPFLRAQLHRAALEAARFRGYAARLRKDKKKAAQALAKLLESHSDYLKETARRHANQLLHRTLRARTVDREPGD